MSRSTLRPRRQQAGFTMLEVLVSLLVFSFGVIALVGLQATAVRLAGDARDRGTATFLADQILGRMLIADPTTAPSFAHRPAAGATCAPGGANSANPIVIGWLAEVAALLPNAPATQQQIVVNGNQVTVRLCWQSGNDAPHELVVTNQVQWQ